jgi:hypothetical protein
MLNSDSNYSNKRKYDASEMDRNNLMPTKKEKCKSMITIDSSYNYPITDKEFVKILRLIHPDHIEDFH